MDYDPTRVTYDQLLNVFWNEHNPTVDNSFRGGQYRSAIFFHDAEQEKLAKASKAALEVRLHRKIYTQILPISKFWRAEDYHQDYYMQDGSSKQCGVR